MSGPSKLISFVVSLFSCELSNTSLLINGSKNKSNIGLYNRNYLDT